MRGYEFTERGKIVIAVVIAIPLFIIAITLAVIAWNNSQPPPDDPPSHSVPYSPEEDPEISDKPLPDGSGFTPHEPSEPDGGEQGEFDPDPDPDSDDSQACVNPEFGPVRVNSSEGTMHFWFSPDRGESLDETTVSMISEFLASPKNTDDAQIVVEMPQLPEEKLSVLINAVIKAFAEHNIPQEALAYSIYQADLDEDAFEVKLYFLLPEDRK